ncbi:MAG: hypothetical protein ACEY3J_02335 [Arsenophonus sp.]
MIKPMKDMAINSCIHPTLYYSSHGHQIGLSTKYYLEIKGLEFTEISLLVPANSACLYDAMGINT